MVWGRLVITSATVDAADVSNVVAVVCVAISSDVVVEAEEAVPTAGAVDAMVGAPSVHAARTRARTMIGMRFLMG